MAGVAASYPMIAGLSAVNPWAGLAALGATGITSYLAGYQAADDIVDVLAGNEPVVMPSETWKTAVGETAGSFPFAFGPAFLPSKINISGASVLNKLYKQLELIKPNAKTVYPRLSSGRIMKSLDGAEFTSLTEGAPVMVFDKALNKNVPLIKNGEIVYQSLTKPISGLTTTESMSNYYRMMENHRLRPASKEIFWNYG